jgi:hypothetical protein
MRDLVRDYGWKQVITCLVIVSLVMFGMLELFVLAFLAGLGTLM